MKRPAIDDLACFFHRVYRCDLTGCWIWMGRLSDGYGILRVDARAYLAHVLAHSWFVSPISEGMECDHLCMNRRCVNPAHLEAVTHVENVQRWARKLTHCVNGHERTPENTYVRRMTDGYSRRLCRLCLQSHRERWAVKVKRARLQEISA